MVKDKDKGITERRAKKVVEAVGKRVCKKGMGHPTKGNSSKSLG